MTDTTDDTSDPLSASEDAYAGGDAGDLAAPIGSSAQATAQAAQQRTTASAPAVAGGAVTNVAQFQAYLNLHGYASPALTVDGKVGPLTSAATKAFQSAHGLTADGIPGPLTFAAASAATAAVASLGTADMPLNYVPPKGVTAPVVPKPVAPALVAAPKVATASMLPSLSPTGKKIAAGLGLLGVVGAVISARR